LVALTLDDIQKTDDGIRANIRRSKTDQEGKGFILAIPNGTRLRIVDSLFDWLKSANITSGHLFRSVKKGGKISFLPLSPRSVANIVKKYAARAGLDVDNFSGHSLRAGFLTSAARAGASITKMMEVSRHADLKTLAGYIRNENLFENHAGEKFL
jgi:integrase